MRLIGKRRSRRQRVARQVENLRKRIPDAPDVTSAIRSELPDMPSIPDIDVRRRIFRDSGKSSESPMLSLAGGLLLGLLVGIVVAVLLIARDEEEGEAGTRQTGITLLTDHGADEHENAAVTG